MGVLTPVLVIGYRRPDLIRKVLQKIPKDGRVIYLYVGAAKTPEEVDAVEATKDECREFSNSYKHTKLRFATSEISMEHGIYGAIDWAFENENRLIILEDDIVPIADFFRFVDIGMEVFENDLRIWQISGFMPLDAKFTKGEPFLGITPTTWGWATWKNRWNGFDLEFDSYSKTQFLEIPWIRNQLLNGKRIRYWDQIFNTCREVQIHWDYQWIFWTWLHGGFVLFPGRQMISNIGFGSQATHTFAASHPSWLKMPSNQTGDLSVYGISKAKFDIRKQKNLDYLLTGIVDFASLAIWLRFSYLFRLILTCFISMGFHRAVPSAFRIKIKKLIL
jgi:hypothetical protein